MDVDFPGDSPESACSLQTSRGVLAEPGLAEPGLAGAEIAALDRAAVLRAAERPPRG